MHAHALLRTFYQAGRLQEGVLVAEAGVTLHNADRCAEEHGHVVPLDLAPKKECQLGGNLATNAGGLRFLRYGSLRGSVVGVEVWTRLVAMSRTA
jgi:FAD/FMN-containing dehydrogenase